MKIAVTGAAGFIGSNIVAGLNARGIDQIIAIDDLTQGDQFRNLADLRISDYVDKDAFYTAFARGDYGHLDAVFHEGACSDTMEHNGKWMMENNFECTKQLLHACQSQNTALLYASSAATYGGSSIFREEPIHEKPLNVYGYSKLLLDQYARMHYGTQLERAGAQVVGFRYFNVYGPREQHKGRMASVAFHQFHQFKKEGKVRLFGAYGEYAAGEQQRDFVDVNDVVAVNLWFLEHPEKRGIFNLGTGRAESFNAVARAVVGTLSPQQAPADSIEYIPFPEALHGKYQSYTRADLSRLRAAGCGHEFADVAQGVTRYMKWLQAQ